MYSELIYTRCGEGVDILRGKSPIRNSGFKVFSCSDNITETGFVDLPFLHAIAQSKEPYADPNFMDDAYLFVVPDLGEKYLLNFHPIPFDRTATGNYSHRPGNFINQIFIGRFDDFYPYELFGDEFVWDAQKKGEAFYYENSPVPLAQRENFGDAPGYISFDDIAAFVADGRRDVLMHAIAFIISQYSLPTEERKFLVIRDEDAKHIELWIAAIENAFSPRMSAGLSFATRLDKFANANKYTVNLDGQYQSQMNLQSPTQKLRFRAMIVGVDERDKANSAVKALANSPYVILDGKSRALSISIDATNPYYRYVTAYDNGHKYFCQYFMQMVDAALPSDDVLKLYSAFISLLQYKSSRQLNDLLSCLKILGQFKLVRTTNLEQLYREIKQEMPNFLRENAISSFIVMNWLEYVASVVGDDSAKDNFKDAVCRSYADNIFMRPQSEFSKELHSVVKKSIFAQDADEYLISQTTVDAYANTTQTYSPADWAAFTEFFVDAQKRHSGGFTETAQALIPKCIHYLYLAKDGKTAVRVASLCSAQNLGQTVEILLTEASYSADQNYIAFLIQLVCRIAPDTITSEVNLMHFYGQLQRANLSSFFSVALAYKAQTLSGNQDMDRFLDWILSTAELKEIDLTAIIKVLDKNMRLSDKAAERLAVKIQQNKTEDLVCINSAHIYAFHALDDKKLANELVPVLNNLVIQGFPSLNDEAYAERLISRLFDTKLPKDAFAIIVAAASTSPFYSNKIAAKAMRCIGTKQDSVVGELIEIAAKTNSEQLFDAIVTVCADMKQLEKGLAAMRETIQSETVQQYFALIEQAARALHEQKKKPSLFGRLFSRGSSDNSKPRE